MIVEGLCQCGCGQKTTVHERNRPCEGIKKGDPRKYILGHAAKGKRSGRWTGGRTIDALGYVRIIMRDHRRADVNGYVKEHVLVAERVLGKPLPSKCSMHHINENRADNRPENLVICQDESYHHLIHDRMRAFRECGHASWRKCWICGEYDMPENMNPQGIHRLCFNAYNQKQHLKRKEAGHVRHYKSYKRCKGKEYSDPSSTRLQGI